MASVPTQIRPEQISDVAKVLRGILGPAYGPLESLGQTGAAAGEAVWQAFQQNPSEFAPLGGVLPAWRQAEQEFRHGRYVPAAIKGTEAMASGLVDVLTGGAAAPIKAAATKTLAPTLASILAYHGTPHAFKKFEMGKIGTGEGATAYGHGLYLAQKKGTAKMYATQLAERGKVIVDGDVIDLGGNTIESAIAAKLSTKMAGNRAVGMPITSNEAVNSVFMDIDTGIQRAMEDGNEALWLAFRDQKLALQRLKERGVRIESSKSNVYEVKISPDEHELLDWFEPLSKQSDQVQSRVKKAFEDAGIPNAAKADTDGQSIYTWLAAAMGRGEKVPDSVLKQRASAALEKAGIPGIKYRDQLSRGTSLDELKRGRQQRVKTIAEIRKRPPSERNSALIAEKERHIVEYDKLIADYKPPTSNYVIFDDSLLEIVGKE